MNGPGTFDTNVAIYAALAEPKSEVAARVVAGANFISVQVLNEFASVMSRKYRRSWKDVTYAIETIRATLPKVLPIDEPANTEALRIAARYQLPFYDALMLAVALSGGARTFYSEDMQHDMIIDDALRIVDPFRPEA